MVSRCFDDVVVSDGVVLLLLLFSSVVVVFAGVVVVVDSWSPWKNFDTLSQKSSELLVVSLFEVSSVSVDASLEIDFDGFLVTVVWVARTVVEVVGEALCVVYQELFVSQMHKVSSIGIVLMSIHD